MDSTLAIPNIKRSWKQSLSIRIPGEMPGERRRAESGASIRAVREFEFGAPSASCVSCRQMSLRAVNQTWKWRPWAAVCTTILHFSDHNSSPGRLWRLLPPVPFPVRGVRAWVWREARDCSGGGVNASVCSERASARTLTSLSSPGRLVVQWFSRLVPPWQRPRAPGQPGAEASAVPPAAGEWGAGAPGEAHRPTFPLSSLGILRKSLQEREALGHASPRGARGTCQGAPGMTGVTVGQVRSTGNARRVMSLGINLGTRGGCARGRRRRRLWVCDWVTFDGRLGEAAPQCHVTSLGPELDPSLVLWRIGPFVLGGSVLWPLSGDDGHTLSLEYNVYGGETLCA